MCLALLNGDMNTLGRGIAESPLNPPQVRDFERSEVPQNGGLGGEFIELFSNAMCFILCQTLTNFYLSVDLVRLDRRTQNIVILSPKTSEVCVSPILTIAGGLKYEAKRFDAAT